MMKSPRILQFAVLIAAVLAAGLAAVDDASAADEAIGFGKEMFKINLGYYRPNFNSRLAAGISASTPGGDINGEDDLGLNKDLGSYRVDGYWRFADRHRLYFGYYQLDRSASRVLTKDIGPIDIPQLGVNDTIKAGSNINTDAKWQIYILAYGYSFYKTDTVELAAQAGINVAQLGARLSGTMITANNGTLTGATAGSVLTVPLPAIGFSGDWALNDSWRVRGHAGAFQLNFENIDTNVVDAGLAGEYRLYQNFWLGMGYSLLNASAARNKTNSNVSFDWRTGGWQLYGSLLF